MCVVCLDQRLDEYGIPIPTYALVNRAFPDQELDYFLEEEDFVEVHGKRIMKPFVEKPVDGKHTWRILFSPFCNNFKTINIHKVCTVHSVEGEDVSSDGLLYTKSLYFENENGCLPSFWMSR